MVVEVETLEKLERKLTLSLVASEVNKEIEKRLKKMAGKVKLDGFRPGKVPLSVVADQYGPSVRYEVINELVGAAFDRKAQEANIKVAGVHNIEELDAVEGDDENLHFSAVFEVFPEIALPKLEALELEALSTEVDEAALTRTIDVLREQRGHFAQRPADAEAVDGERVTVNFEGKIDGEPFAGGQAEDFPFQLGKGQMLVEFEDAVRGMKVGESRTFPLEFPKDYHGAEVAGKKADFLVTLRKLEAQQLPEVNEEFVKALGVASGKLEDLHADIRKNLEREVKSRLKNRNKTAALNLVTDKAELDAPKSLVQSELQRLIASTREDLKKRGIKDAEKAPIPEELFQEQAERRVRMGLVFRELVAAFGLEAKPEQVSAHIEEIANSYEKPADVIQWYGAERSRMAEVEALVLEENVADLILSKAKVVDKPIEFDELMQTKA